MRYLLVLCVLVSVGCSKPTMAELKLKREEMQNISERAWVGEYAAELSKDAKKQEQYRAEKDAALLQIKRLDRQIEITASR